MEKIYIQKLLHELKELEILKDDLSAEIKKYEDKIKEFMSQRSLEELLGDNGERVIFKPIISKRFDTTAFKKKFYDLYEAYTKTTTNHRFKLTY